MTPADYRAKWDLPHDDPMMAPAYAKARSALATSLGLGTARRKTQSQLSIAVEAALDQA